MGVTEYKSILKSAGIITPQLVESSGQVWFVGNGNALGSLGAIGASDGNDGLSPLRPFASLAKAVTMAASSAGDVVYVLPYHSETISASLAVSKRGMQIVGLGVGSARPTFVTDAAVDVLDITGAGIRISNLIFSASTAAATARINVGAGGVTVDRCRFYCGASDAQTVTIPDVGDDVKLLKNEFIVTANGPQTAIRIESATSARVQIHENYFDGNSAANAWDNGAIYSTVAHTNCWVQENTFRYGIGVNFTAAATGFLVWNYGGGVYVPGNCEVLMPGGGSGGLGTGTGSITPDAASGSSADSVTGESTTGDIFYVDSTAGNDANDGLTPITALATLGQAVSMTAAGDSDIIVLMPGFAENLASQVVVANAGVKILGMGNGASTKPAIRAAAGYAAATSPLSITGVGVEIAGIRFNAAAGGSASVGLIDVAANAHDFYLHDCELNHGGVASEVDGIRFLGAVSRPTIEGNIFTVIALGTARAISISTAAVTDAKILGNTFRGMSTANSWSAAAIFSNQTTTGLIVSENSFYPLAANIHAIQVGDGSSTGLISKNVIVGQTLGFGISAQGVQVSEDNYYGNDSAFTSKGRKETTGALIFVDSAKASTNGTGRSPATAVATLALGVGRASAGVGDIIYVMPGHSETGATALAVQVNINKADVKIIGLGSGSNRPTFANALGAADQDFLVSAANVTIENIAFNASGTVGTPGHIAIGANANYTKIKDCYFVQGANDLYAIEVEGSSNDVEILNNEFVVTANGPTHCIYNNTGSIIRGRYKDNFFSGGSAVNAWDTACIWSSQRDFVEIEDNTFIYAATNTSFVVYTDNTSDGLIHRNAFLEYSPAFACLNAPGFGDTDNYYQFSGAKEYQGSEQTTGQYIYVWSGVAASGNGTSPQTAFATLAGGLGVASANRGDVVLVMPGHAETLTATVTFATAGVRIIGLGKATAVPAFTANGAAPISLFTINANNVKLENLAIAASTAANTDQIHINNGIVGFGMTNCQVTQGANDVLSVVFGGTSNGCSFDSCSWTITADGADRSISAAAGVQTRMVVQNCTFSCANAANGWDDAAIWSDQANSEVLIKGNSVRLAAAGQYGIEFTAATTGLISNNVLAGGVPTALDPGSCACVGNAWTDGVATDGNMIPAPFFSGYVPGLGFKVSRGPGDVFDGTAFPIFTIAGGRVLITSLSVSVGTANLDADACDLNFLSNPTVGTTTAMSGVLAIISDENGSVYSLTGDPTVATTGGTGAGAQSLAYPYIASVGAIEAQTTADMNNGGGATQACELWYIPLDPGATVTPTP